MDVAASRFLWRRLQRLFRESFVPDPGIELAVPKLQTRHSHEIQRMLEPELAGKLPDRDLPALGLSIQHTGYDLLQAESKGMNILVLTDSFLPHSGGSRIYYYNLYSKLVSQFPDHVTILTKKVPGWQEFDRRQPTNSLQIIRRFKPLATWKYHQWPKIIFPFAEALRLVRKKKIDLIHTGDLYPPGVIALWLKHLIGVPYISYCHGEEVTQTEKRRYQPLVRNKIYQGADGVVAACEFARANLVRLGIPENRICKITPGVDCERFSPRPPSIELIRRFSLEHKHVLLTVARLWPRKGHDLVIRALAKIRHEIPSIAYLIAGKGPEEERLRRLAAEAGVADLVTFVGYVPDEELAGFYDLCDLFIMPNRGEPDGDIEGFGMVFLEANAAGKAVVGGRSGGTADAIVDGVTGLLVNPEDVEEVSAAMRQLLLNPPLRKQMADAGLRRARSEFSWKRRAELLGEFCREVIERTCAGAREKMQSGHRQ